MNIRIEKECNHCWKFQHMLADRSRCNGPRIEWTPYPNTTAKVRVTYRFLSEKYQKDYKAEGNTFPLINLFDINGAVTGIGIVFEYYDPYYLVYSESEPIWLNELQLYTIRDIIGTGSYLYGEMSAF